MLSITPEDLRKVNALSDQSDELLHWLLNHCDYVEYDDGSHVAKYGQEAEVMWFLLEGKVNFYMVIHGREVYYYTFENSVNGGVGGLIPYSRMKTYPGNSYATGHVRMIRLHKQHFHDLELLFPDFMQRLIGYMTERAKSFATTQLQHEKVNSLGLLAAGIAHEINNPAAAINSISNELNQRLAQNYKLTEDLIQCNISLAQLHHIRELIKTKEEESRTIKLSLLRRMEIEEAMLEWLEKNQVPDSNECAETFMEFNFSTAELEEICAHTGKDAFVYFLPWLENILSSRKLIQDLEHASFRISKLVGAIKSHVHMDRTEDLQSTDIHNDLENTLTLMGHKLREKNISVIKEYGNLPGVPAYVSELNQVWTNLIDNAIYAVAQKGIITIRTEIDGDKVKVTIRDNGSGIPTDIMSRIFDPFFTTKKVGEGTGIGLDIVNKAIRHHHGEIKVNSVPGRTEFIICLPLIQHES
jgi:signal transduction histidine kinase